MLDSQSADLVGQSIAGRYAVESVIGHGGQGVVYRARDNRGGRAVAIKVLSLLAARDPQAAERFLREQAALQALAGTAAVQVLDAGETGDGSLYLVLELLEGRDLEQELEELEARSERVDLRRVARLMSPLAETLDAAHGQGIMHRDLKPANIFLLRDGGVRLLDFGFARLRSARPLTAVGTVVGSPSYIAPEVWKGRPELLDHRVDVYSLAVIMFRMLSGALPFESKEIVEVLKMATTGKRPSLHGLRPDLPPRVDLWVEQALAIDPDRRYASAGECLEQLYVSAGAGRVLASVREAQKPPTEQQASAAERVASVLQNAAAALKRWTVGKDKAKKPEAKAEQPAAKPRTRTVPPTKQRTGKTLPKIPKLAPSAQPAKTGKPPPPPTAKGRTLSPPSRTKPGRTQPERSVSKTMRALSPGKLPPPPKLPSKSRKP